MWGAVATIALTCHKPNVLRDDKQWPNKVLIFDWQILLCLPAPPSPLLYVLVCVSIGAWLGIAPVSQWRGDCSAGLVLGL